MSESNFTSAGAWTALATGAAFCLAFLGIGGCCYLVAKGSAEEMRAKQGVTLAHKP